MLGEPKRTRMTPQFIDMSIWHPLSLGRPFLATSQALLDVSVGKLELRTGDEKVTFRLPNTIKHYHDFDDLCYCADVIGNVIDEHVHEFMQVNSLKVILEEEEEEVEKQGPQGLEEALTMD